MNAHLVSIIVPIYNCMEYFDRCMRSLLAQEYENIEIILIDDGSTDGSGALCDRFSEQHRHVVTKHTSNQGASEARNLGIKISKGEYIAFVDSDDFVHPRYIGEMMRCVEQYNCDLVQCGYEKGRATTFTRDDQCKRVVVTLGYEALLNNSLNIVVWGKLYAKELFDNVLFPPRRIHEDEFVTYKIAYKAEKVVLVDSVLYYYYQSPASVMRGQKYLNRYDFIDAYEERIAYFRAKGEYPLETVSIKLYMLRLILYYGNQVNIYKQNGELFRKKCKYYFQTKGRDIFFSKYVSIPEKVLFISFMLSPRVTSKLSVNIYNRRQSNKYTGDKIRQ